MVGVRSVKAKWPVYIELVGLPNATKSIKENRITISGTDFNAVHPELKKNQQNRSALACNSGKLTVGKQAATMNCC